MTRKPQGRHESSYNEWCRHSRGCNGPRKQCGGGRAGLNRAMRRDGRAMSKGYLEDYHNKTEHPSRAGIRRFL